MEDIIENDSLIIKRSLKSIFKYPFLIEEPELNTNSSKFLKDGSFKNKFFKLKVKNILFNCELLKIKSFSSHNVYLDVITTSTIHYNATINEKKLQLFYDNIQNNLIENSFSVYEKIKHIIKKDYNTFYNIDVTFINIVEEKSTNYKIGYNLKLFNLNIEIEDSNAFDYIKIKLNDDNNKFKTKTLKIKKVEDISDLFSFILKKLTLNFNNYIIPDNIDSIYFNDFINDNILDIYKMNEILNY